MPVDTPFEMRAGVRVFITAPRDTIPDYHFGDDGGLWEQNFRATLVSQHSKDHWWAQTERGERVLVAKADVVPLEDVDRAGIVNTLLLWAAVLAILGVTWFFLGEI